MSQHPNPNDWIDFTIPEVSTDANADAYGPAHAIPRQSAPQIPQSPPAAVEPSDLPEGFAGPPAEMPTGAQLPTTVPATNQVPQGPGDPQGKREWVRFAIFVGVGASLLAATHYGKKLWERWFGK